MQLFVIETFINEGKKWEIRVFISLAFAFWVSFTAWAELAGTRPSIVIIIANEEGRKEHLPHPEHKKFVRLLKPILEDVFVIDYWSQQLFT